MGDDHRLFIAVDLGALNQATASAAGRFDSLAEARSHVAGHVRSTSFAPKPTAASARAALRCAAVQEQVTQGIIPCA